jgi:hypothetical protein
MSSKFYTDPQFNTFEVYGPLPPVPVAIPTSTAGTSTTVLNTNCFGTPIFLRPTKITNVTVDTVSAPGVTPGTLTLLNIVTAGTTTTTLGTIVVPAAGTNSPMTLTAGSNTFAAGQQPIFVYQGTASATTVSIGIYNVYMDTQEVFN